MPPSLTPGSSSIVSVQNTDVDIGLRHGPRDSALPTSRNPFRAGHGFRGYAGSLLLRPVRLLAPLYGPDRSLGQRGFYFQAFNGSVVLPVAGYDYNSDWTPLLAGLSPAGMAASLAALARPCGARWSCERANVRAASMYSASEVERLCSGPRWVSARIQGLLPERPHEVIMAPSLWVAPGRPFVHLLIPSRRPSVGTYEQASSVSDVLTSEGSRKAIPSEPPSLARPCGERRWRRGDGVYPLGGPERAFTTRHRQRSSVDRHGRALERPRRCGRACWRVRSPACCGEAVSMPSRSMATDRAWRRPAVGRARHGRPARIAFSGTCCRVSRSCPGSCDRPSILAWGQAPARRRS